MAMGGGGRNAGASIGFTDDQYIAAERELRVGGANIRAG